MTTTAQRYAISHWPDMDELIAKGHRLVSAPPRPIRRDKMQDYLAYLETRCAGSKASTAEAAKHIPGGVQHNVAFNYPFPLNIAPRRRASSSIRPQASSNASSQAALNRGAVSRLRTRSSG